MTTNGLWISLLDQILDSGKHRGATGATNEGSREILGSCTRWDLGMPLVTLRSRRLNYRFAAAEAAWMIGGGEDVATIAKYNKNISKFSDNGFTFFGAYGPKILDQFEGVVKKLANDPCSRQAVINIWRENPPDNTRDTPCTLSLQFLLETETLALESSAHILNVVSTMRSNDAWLGLPYDLFNFSQIAVLVAARLSMPDCLYHDVKLGTLFHNVGSMHVYEKDVQIAKLCVDGWKKYLPDGDGIHFTLDRLDPRDVAEQHPRARLLKLLWCVADGDIAGRPNVEYLRQMALHTAKSYKKG